LGIRGRGWGWSNSRTSPLRKTLYLSWLLTAKILMV
jgi:hypothetical protein